MDLLTLVEKLDARGVEPVYLVHGPERFLVDLLVRRLREIIVTGAMSDFNFHRLAGGEASGAEIVAEARAVPMMATQKLVVVEQGDKLRAADLEVLDAYLADPVPETCLVIAGNKFDLRRGAFARANKRGQVHKAEALKERQLARFVRLRAQARGVELEPGAESAIAAAVGPDCAALDDAVERVGLYAGEGQAAGESHVAEVVSAVRQHSVFELVDAIGNRDQARALELLLELLRRREEPLRVSALIARHLRQLIAARAHLHLGTEPGRVAGSLGVPNFVAKKLLAQSRSFRGAELESALLRLSTADLELKSSRRPSELVLEAAVMDLCL
jgi:DNA polymerase-3 subunit delta